MTQVTRRTFGQTLAALAAAPAAWHGEQVPATGSCASAPLRIDFLATPGPFNTPDDFAAPLDPEMVRNTVESGIAAVNLSVDGDTVEETFNNIGVWERELDGHPDALVRVRSLADVDAARQTCRLGLMYGFQSTGVAGNDLNRLELFSRFGVRIVQLTYNRRELVGDGCLEPANAGLSKLGFEAVERLNALRTVIDVSHCGQRTTADAIGHSSAPVAISHAGCQALANLPRNKADAELRATAKRGGVIGIYLMPFLAVDRAPTADDVIRHVEHAINVCGEDHVGIGSDCSITPHVVTDKYREAHRRFVLERRRRGVAAPGEDPEVFFFVPDLNNPRRLDLIADLLRGRGHSASRIDKVIGGNWRRLLHDVWGER